MSDRIPASKRKGGAERSRDKKKQQLHESAKKCKSIIDVFAIANNKTILENVEGVDDSNDTSDTTILAKKPTYNALKNYEDSSAYDSPATSSLASSYQLVSFSTICLLFNIPIN
uniref:Uncharacterized protein n=1 Tax=Schizaphis graminum TaxID=13262 RepID=A0A2S2P2F1_SCHGA